MKNEKKSLKEKISLYFDDERHVKNAYTVIQLVVMGLIVLSYFFSWQWNAVAIALLVWNFCWYNIGYKSNVIDEWEDGYPRDGLRYMFDSWIAFAILAGIFLIVSLNY